MKYGVYPVRPWNSFYLTTSGYLSPAYLAAHGKYHRGEDINKITGGDSDYGYPVQSMFPGQVIYADTPANSNWGGIVLIRTEDWLKEKIAAQLKIPLEVLEVQYAHLQHITVKEGMYINAGDHIGSIGKGGNNLFVAHLHLEMRRKSFSAFHPQGNTVHDLAETANSTIDPKLILSLPLGDFSDFIPSGRRELSAGRLIVNDGTAERGLILVNRVNDKIYVKRV
jgi:murein DD-endopeptidase MepM/ murein hydrolase activator NlpD